MAVKGKKRIGRRSSNTKASDNIISDGSIIAVADGQCMLIVEQGKVVEICAEPGEFIYDFSTEPSIFQGNLSESIGEVFKTLGKRFTFGGEPPKDQRVYYINTKEIFGNKYGTPSPIIFKITDRDANIYIDMPIRCFGEYSYKITNPPLFYTNVCANFAKDFTRDKINEQMKSELLTHLGPAFARISAKGIRYYELMGHTFEIRDALKEELSQEWKGIRGIELINFGISSISGDEKVEEKLRNVQLYSRNSSALAAEIGASQAEAMKMAASNQGAGSAMAFMGMGMANQMGNMNTANLFQMGQQQIQQQQQQQQPQPQKSVGWACSCGHTGNMGKFCAECGASKPVENVGWECSCGTMNKGKFCTECGKPRPSATAVYKCDKCGWEPEDPMNPPKFCPQCGDPFNNSDIR